jgi:hypothetical protein
LQNPVGGIHKWKFGSLQSAEYGTFFGRILQNPFLICFLSAVQDTIKAGYPTAYLYQQNKLIPVITFLSIFSFSNV